MAEREIKVHISKLEATMAVVGPLLAGAGVALDPILYPWSIMLAAGGVGMALGGFTATGERVCGEKHGGTQEEPGQNALLEE